MVITNAIIAWLLKGDVAIQYQVHRDLLQTDRNDLRQRIGSEGWGAKFLGKQMKNGDWGISFYQPKWTSTHYTLLDLKNLSLAPDTPRIRETIAKIARNDRGKDGGIHPKGSGNNSDVCINGMFLNYASYFLAEEDALKPGIDFILSQRMRDGGFNCRLNRSGAKHSSLHTTLCAVEGIREYNRNHYTYRLNELLDAEKSSVEFMLQHQLYISDRTGDIINPGFLSLAYPGRWRYDILRALDYLRLTGTPTEIRLTPALDMVIKKRRKNGTWNCSQHQGQIHFRMEEPRKPSRWNTLRALRVLSHFDYSDDNAQ